MSDNLPPGLDHSHPYFHEDPDLPCVCGHSRDEHEADDGECFICVVQKGLGEPDEICEAYEPDEEAPPR